MNPKSGLAVLLLAGSVALGTGCGGGEKSDGQGGDEDGKEQTAASGGQGRESGMNTLTVTSKAFTEGATIPVPYTCDAEDVSPRLAWSDPPANTRSFALICDDPDAPGKTWVHWVLFNLPASMRELPSGVEAGASHADGSVHGKNDFGDLAYGGPCPPPGKPHRYVFKLYALDTMLDLEAGVDKSRVLSAMEGHVLAEGRLTGTYARN